MSDTVWTVVYVECGNGIAAYVEELPGVQACEGSIEEAEQAIRAALELTIAANRRAACEVYRGCRVVRRQVLAIIRAWRSVRACPSISVHPVTAGHSN